MIIRYSLCGCIKLESYWDEEPTEVSRIKDFISRMKFHYASSDSCRLKYYQDIVVGDIIKEKVDA